MRWRLVLPVKEARSAKTRLHAPAQVSRADLARAIALDTLQSVCRALPPWDVVTVTSDPVVSPAASALGARVLADPGAGLNAAIAEGIVAALDPAVRPEDTRGELAHGAGLALVPEGPVAVAVLLGDLPALRPQDLLTALAACAEHDRAVVPDHEGSGTVLLTARPGIPLEPRFGSGSAARHAEVATVLTPDLPRLRQDVDDLAALRAAVALGVGPHTTRALGVEHGAAAAAN